MLTLRVCPDVPKMIVRDWDENVRKLNEVQHDSPATLDLLRISNDLLCGVRFRNQVAKLLNLQHRLPSEVKNGKHHNGENQIEPNGRQHYYERGQIGQWGSHDKTGPMCQIRFPLWMVAVARCMRQV